MRSGIVASGWAPPPLQLSTLTNVAAGNSSGGAYNFTVSFGPAGTTRYLVLVLGTRIAYGGEITEWSINGIGGYPVTWQSPAQHANTAVGIVTIPPECPSSGVVYVKFPGNNAEGRLRVYQANKPPTFYSVREYYTSNTTLPVTVTIPLAKDSILLTSGSISGGITQATADSFDIQNSTDSVVGWGANYVVGFGMDQISNEEAGRVITLVGSPFTGGRRLTAACLI